MPIVCPSRGVVKRFSIPQLLKLFLLRETEIHSLTCAYCGERLRICWDCRRLHHVRTERCGCFSRLPVIQLGVTP